MTDAPERLVILGAGGNCVDILEAILQGNEAAARTAEPTYEVVGFLDDDDALHGRRIHGVPVLGDLEHARDHADARFVSGLDSPRWFRRKPEILARTGLSPERFTRVVHPSAVVSRWASLGHGAVVLQNAVIASGARLGAFTTVLPTSVVSHDASLGDHTCLAGGVVVCGGATIGDGAYLGAGATIRDGVRVGARAMVGMGSVVLDDVADDAVVAGNPAGPLPASTEPGTER